MLELRAVESRPGIEACVYTLFNQFARGASEISDCRPGFGGGSISTALHFRREFGVWMAHEDFGTQHWFPFGLGQPQPGQSPHMTVQINPPRKGIDRNLQGVVAVCPRGRVWLCHRGRVNLSGPRSILPTLGEVYRGHERATVRSSDGRTDEVIAVCRPGSRSAVRDLATYVHAAALYKQMGRRILEARS